jgi:endonuclease/exonuclease/phosphatase family metal-dependent hydrolase
MRVLAAVLLIVVSALSVSVARSRQDAPQLEAPRRPRIVTELSELLTHSPLETCQKSNSSAVSGARPLRIGTWTIRAAQSAPVDMLAAEIRAMQVDVIALQEVDVRTRRGGFVDEPTELASALGLQYVFAASIKWDEGHYGLAVLSRWPLVKVERHRLSSTPEAEPRIVLDVTVCAAGKPLHLLNTHADRRAPSRALGFADTGRIVKDEIGRGSLLLGDRNEYPDAPGVRSLIDAGLVDVSAGISDTVSVGRVDYVLADPPLARIASPARVWTTDKSDHHAVLVDLAW